MDDLATLLARPELLTILLTIYKAIDLAKFPALRDLNETPAEAAMSKRTATKRSETARAAATPKRTQQAAPPRLPST